MCACNLSTKEVETRKISRLKPDRPCLKSKDWRKEVKCCLLPNKEVNKYANHKFIKHVLRIYNQFLGWIHFYMDLESDTSWSNDSLLQHQLRSSDLATAQPLHSPHPKYRHMKELDVYIPYTLEHSYWFVSDTVLSYQLWPELED